MNWTKKRLLIDNQILYNSAVHQSRNLKKEEDSQAKLGHTTDSYKR